MNFAWTAWAAAAREPLLLGRRVAAPLREPPGGLGHALRLGGRRLLLLRSWSWIWLAAVLMNVPGP